MAKNAIHAGSLERIRQWVDKHYIGLGGATLSQYIDHATHAEKVTKGKKKGTDIMYEGAEGVFNQGR